MQQFVLVAGVDYHFGGVDFRRITDARRRVLERRHDNSSDLRFVTFDVRTGQVETRQVSFATGRRVESVQQEKLFDTVQPASYERVDGDVRFRSGQRDVMSITDVYAAVQQVGQQAPGTLAELSIVSHGWVGGPILVNSDDDRTMTVQVPSSSGVGTEPFRLSLNGSGRDPDDKDARAWLDFRAPTMSQVRRLQFQEAFADGAVAWLWGCAFPRVVNELLAAIQRAPGYRRAPMGRDVELTLTRLSRDAVDYLEQLLDGYAGPWPGRAPVRVPFGLLRYAVAAANQTSYAVALADAAGCDVHAAALGTYADYDKGGERLLHVPASFDGHLAFYRHHLGIGSDPERRRYAVYRPGLLYPDPS